MKYIPFSLNRKLFLCLSSCFLEFRCTLLFMVVVRGGRKELSRKKIGERRLFPMSQAFHFFKFLQCWVGYCMFCGILTQKMGKRKKGNWRPGHCTRPATHFSLTTARRDLYFVPFRNRAVKLQTPKPLLPPDQTCFWEAVVYCSGCPLNSNTVAAPQQRRRKFANLYIE